MEFKWMVTATNAQGDFFEKKFKDAKLADICHKRLYHEVDDRGLWKWGSIRTTNMDTMRADYISGILGDRTKEVA